MWIVLHHTQQLLNSYTPLFFGMFYNLCAGIATLSMNVGDKIHCFVDGIKLKIRLKVVVDPLNDAQPWKDFQRLGIDFNLQQVKYGLGVASTENSEEITPSKGVGGPIKITKNSTMKFTNDTWIKYKIVVALKKECKCYFSE